MDTETAAMSWLGEDEHGKEAALVASIEAPHGRQTLAVVAHGLMGQGGAPIPMSIVIEVARRHFAAAAHGQDAAAPEAALEALTRAAQEALFDVAERKRYDMGATFAAAWFCGRRVAIAHSGDCQVYVRRAGEGFVKLTVDHTVDEEIRRFYPDRWSAELAEQYRNVLVRCLGFERPAPSASDGASDGAPAALLARWEITGVDARPGDIFLLVTNEVAERADRRAPPFCIEAGETLQGALARYIEARPKDGKREISAAAVRLVDHATDLVPERVAGAGFAPELVKRLLAK
jgi:serine/threonine protein phosphatase PrpC